MQTWSNYARNCTKPEIIAGRLTAIRNIYLRQELRTISDQIQKQYNERLPALQLVSLVAYEQVFNRQPLFLPEELRRDSIKYGLKYYQLNIEKLRIAETQNGLNPNHDKKSSLNHDHSEENQSNKSFLASDKTFDSTTTDISSITAPSSLDEVSSTATNEHNFSPASTFSDTNISVSHTDSKSTSKSRKLSRRKPPKIVIRRPSDSSLTSNKTKNSSKTFAKKQSNNTHRRPSKKRRRKKKKKI